MQYYERPQNSEINVLLKSIERFMECIDNLDEFRVLGGDPFMNKELYKIINKLVTYEKCKKIVVYTNAKIVPKSPIEHPSKHQNVFNLLRFQVCLQSQKPSLIAGINCILSPI